MILMALPKGPFPTWQICVYTAAKIIYIQLHVYVTSADGGPNFKSAIFVKQ